MSFFNMSLRSQIVIPLLVAILAGVGVSALIGKQASNGQQRIAEIVEQALDARTQSSDIKARIDDAEEDIAQVLSMTTFVSAKETSAIFKAHDDDITQMLARFANNTLSADINGEVMHLTRAYETWRASVQSALGLVATKNVPTKELLNREYHDLATISHRVDELVTTTAHSKTQTAHSDLNRSVQFELIALILGGLLAFAVSWFIAGRIARPIQNLADTMDELAKGKIDLSLPPHKFAAEINHMIIALEVFQQNAHSMRVMDRDKESQRLIDQGQLQARQDMQGEIARVVDLAVAGDFTGRISRSYDDAELNSVVASLNELVSTVERGISETGVVLSALAEADLTLRVTGAFNGSFLRLKNDTNSLAESLTVIIGQLRNTSGGLKLATSEIVTGANTLSNRTAKQAATIEETSAAMGQLAVTVQENAHRAQEARTHVGYAQEIAEQGVAVMGNTTDAMDRIRLSSSKISDIIGLIDDIAFQTNLLALNASVEAARAGEAGKGFAVVAVEVRRLAQSAAKASSEVKQLIDQSGSEVQNGSKLVAEAAQNLEGIVASVHGMTDMMNQIADESSSQASSIDQLNQSIRYMDEMTQHNVVLVSETNATIKKSEVQAKELDQIVEMFSVQSPLGNAAPATLARKTPARIATVQPYSFDGNAALNIEKDWDDF